GRYKMTTESSSSLSSLSSSSSDDFGATWILDAANLVFFLQAGFGMIEAGMVRAKNTKSILLKNLINTAIGAIGFYCFGHAFAFGPDWSNGFIGFGSFFLRDYNNYAYWLIQWAYASTATTIATGAMAERTQMPCYLLFSLLQTTLIYPVVAHWIWSSGNGWLASLGIADFAGGAVVHIVAGACGACGSFLLGPRIGRFDHDNGRPKTLPGHNVVLTSLGAMILWYSWYGYTSGASIGMASTMSISRVSIVATLSGATGLLTVLAIGRVFTGQYDLVRGINGLVVGLVSSTAGCAYIEPWAGIIVGFVGAVIYYVSSWILLNWAKIDDPVDATSVHLFGGAWSVISLAFFASHGKANGIFYGGGIGLLWVQLVGVAMATMWAICVSTVFFLVMKYMNWFRVDVDTELAGLDNMNHGGAAYIFD
ncbi:hypothetical protein SAMD00019534_041090, partial [Acytostelium subglobosum LB1]|uniref:hypothetical protein n=1 Tax=Acytostelium subglobosum LB1 TaxID=1410327 RepID=UPI0006451881